MYDSLSLLGAPASQAVGIKCPYSWVAHNVLLLKHNSHHSIYSFPCSNLWKGWQEVIHYIMQLQHNLWRTVVINRILAFTQNKFLFSFLLKQLCTNALVHFLAEENKNQHFFLQHSTSYCKDTCTGKSSSLFILQQPQTEV